MATRRGSHIIMTSCPSPRRPIFEDSDNIVGNESLLFIEMALPIAQLWCLGGPPEGPARGSHDVDLAHRVGAALASC